MGWVIRPECSVKTVSLWGEMCIVAAMPPEAAADIQTVSESFTGWDWAVVFVYLLICTGIGHLMRGKQATIRDFFLGGRSLPWPAVSGSIIATEISGVTFIGVPGMVFALMGDFTYLQWALGSIIARFVIGLFLVKYYYEREIYSPYEFMGHRLGGGIKTLATIIFAIGSILGQSVRVLVAALALDVVTPMPFEWCIVVIGLFAIVWTLMGGMSTVIWTDVMQFILFALGGFVALFWIVNALDSGWADFWNIGSGARGIEALWTPGTEASPNKFYLINPSFDKNAGFTLWVAILAAPFLNLSAFGVDQLNAQRMFCCRSAKDASKAIIFSSIGQIVTILMLMVGAALFVYYREFPPNAALEARFEENHDYVFPSWITVTLPPGLSGLILAGVFAAAISSLDSILAALSQTTLSLFHPPDREHTPEQGRKLVMWSRVLVVCWGLFLTYFAIVLDKMRGDINMVNLAFGMVAYTAGPMLGMLICAIFFRNARVWGLAAGFVLSFLLVLFYRTDLYTILIKKGVTTAEAIASWAPVAVVPGEPAMVDATVNYAWAWPVTTFLTVFCGLLSGWISPRNRPVST